MPQVLVTEQYLEDIADSIRAKNGSANTYTPAQMANAISAINTSGGGSGGGSSNILSGINTPAAELGNDGCIYLRHNGTYDATGVLSYLRTNNNVLDLTLSNWLYRASDKIILDYKNVGQHTGNWGVFIQLSNTEKLIIHYNLYSNRNVINVKHNGAYSGDTNYAFDSPRNVEKYYRIILDGSQFSIMSALNRGNYINNEVGAFIGTEDDTDIGNPILFPSNSGNALNIEFHELKVYRNDNLIHFYVPIQNGVVDVVDQTTFEISNASITYGSAISELAESGMITNAYYKKSGAWQELIGTSIGDVNV